MAKETCDDAPYTYVLVGGLVERDQVGVEASQTHHRPEGEEANQELQHREEELRKQWDEKSAMEQLAGNSVVGLLTAKISEDF